MVDFRNFTLWVSKEGTVNVLGKDHYNEQCYHPLCSSQSERLLYSSWTVASIKSVKHSVWVLGCLLDGS